MSLQEMNKHFDYRKSELEEIIKSKSDYTKYEEKLTELEESILSVDISKTYNILLSYGGPADGFKVDTNSNNELTGVRYWFAEWFTYDEVNLTETERENFLSVYGYLLELHGILY